jgi:soluble lytic murein transglycosylase-like protein
VNPARRSTCQIKPHRAIVVLVAVALPLGGCSTAGLPAMKPAPARAALPAPVAATPETVPALAYAPPPGRQAGSMDRLIARYAALYDVPESLIRRVIMRESGYNPTARNGPYYGLMQIRHDTARSMGYSGGAAGLLDADTNLRYAVKYLRGAWLCAEGSPDRAVRYYASGYYYVAKHKGLLDEVGL